MSGRAGRRGLDDKGIVIMMVDEKMSPSVGKNLVKVSPACFSAAQPACLLQWTRNVYSRSALMMS